MLGMLRPRGVTAILRSDQPRVAARLRGGDLFSYAVCECTFMIARCCNWFVAWGSREICPWLNPYLDKIKTPLGVLLLVWGASLLCALTVSPHGFVVCGAIAVVIGIAVVWPWIMVQGITGELDFLKTRITEGSELEIELRVRNRWPFSVWGLKLDERLEVEEEPLCLTIARVPGWTTTRFRWNRTMPCRGCYPRTKVRLSTAFPFGIGTRRKHIDLRHAVYVWPRVTAVHPKALTLGDRPLLASLPSDGRAGQQGDRTGVRWYRQGDSARSIHWPLSARYDRLVVSEREYLAASPALIRIDLDKTIHTGVGVDASVEWVIRYAAGLALELLKSGIPIELCADGEDSLSVLPHPDAQLRVLDWLTLLKPAANAVQGVASPLRTDGERYLVTTEKRDARPFRGWHVLAIGRQTDRHRVHP